MTTTDQLPSQQQTQATQPESVADMDADIQDGAKKVKIHFNIPILIGGLIVLIVVIVIGLVVLEKFGVMDDFVDMKTGKHHQEKK